MIIDVNANLSRWPFRRTPSDELPRLVETCQRHGVSSTWVGSLDGLFHRDLGGVNLRLAEVCSQERGIKLIPFGSVNPLLPDWQEDLRRCCEEYRMPGIRLHPNYHGYALDHPVFSLLLDLVAERGAIAQLVVRMDDVRVQHPLMRIPDLDTKPLADLVKARPRLRLVLLNGLATLRAEELRSLVAAERIWFDIAMKDGVGGVAELLRLVPQSRILFGTHTPLFPLESAVFKMRESELNDSQRRAIEYENAEQLLGSKT